MNNGFALDYSECGAIVHSYITHCTFYFRFPHQINNPVAVTRVMARARMK